VIRSLLVLLALTLMPAGLARALDEGKREGGGPRPLSEGESDIVRERERMREEYRRMREARIKALRQAAGPASPHSTSGVPGWRTKERGKEPPPPKPPPGPLGASPADYGNILLITMGVGLTGLIVLRLVRTVKRTRKERPMRKGAHIADGPVTLTIRPRPGGIRGDYSRLRKMTSETSSANVSTPSSSR
jgi:hypothetical protein